MKLPLLHTSLLLAAVLSSLLGTSFGAPCTLATSAAGVRLEACPDDVLPNVSKTAAFDTARKSEDKEDHEVSNQSHLPFSLNDVLSGGYNPYAALSPRAGGTGPPPPPPLPPAPKAGSSNTGPGIRLKTNRPPSVNPPPARETKPVGPNFKKNAAGVEPGSGTPQDTGPRRTVAEIEVAGKRQWDAYLAAVRKHAQDTKIIQDKSQLPASAGGVKTAFLDVQSVKGYQIKSKKISNPTQGNLHSIGLFDEDETSLIIKNTEMAQEVQIVPSADTGKSIVKMTIDSGGRYFIMQDSFKATDQTGSGIPLNEMVMQNFLDVAGTNADKFTVMFIVNIQNQEFWNVVRASYDEAKKPFDRVLTFTPEKQKAAFERFMGTPNISSKLFGFQNHYNAIGKKTPKSIIVIPKQSPDADDLSIALVFVDTPASKAGVLEYHRKSSSPKAT